MWPKPCKELRECLSHMLVPGFKIQSSDMTGNSGRWASIMVLDRQKFVENDIMVRDC